MNNPILSLLINILGLGILMWFLVVAFIDVLRGNKQKSVFHNWLIIGICLVYSLKIIFKDLLGLV